MSAEDPRRRETAPDRYHCGGPASEVVDCWPGGYVIIERRVVECATAPLTAGIQVGVAGFSATLPVCVGTEHLSAALADVDGLVVYAGRGFADAVEWSVRESTAYRAQSAGPRSAL